MYLCVSDVVVNKRGFSILMYFSCSVKVFEILTNEFWSCFGIFSSYLFGNIQFLYLYLFTSILPLI